MNLVIIVKMQRRPLLKNNLCKKKTTVQVLVVDGCNEHPDDGPAFHELRDTGSFT